MDRMIYSNIGSLVKPEYRFILDVINERLVGKSKYSPDTSEEDYKWFQSTFSGIMEEAYEKLIA